MKREINLIRKIILAVEEHPHGYAPREITIDGYSEEQIGYHSYLIVADGLADGRDVSRKPIRSPLWEISVLTPKGHDFAEAVRNETVWAKTKAKLAEIGSEASLQVVAQLALSFLKPMLGIP